jgi:hypothetical protein
LVPNAKGTSIGKPQEPTEENPAGRRLRCEKKEEESSANLSKKIHPKKILFLTVRFASIPFQRWQYERLGLIRLEKLTAHLPWAKA